MKTYTFKDEFENKLRTLKIKTKFLCNIRRYVGENSMMAHLETLEKQNTWTEFVMTAFKWAESPEGLKFWIDVAASDVVGRESTWSRS